MCGRPAGKLVVPSTHSHLSIRVDLPPLKEQSTLSLLQRAQVHTPNAWSAFIGSVLGLGGLVLLDQFSRQWDERLMLFVGSFGALSTILYGAPAAPLGRIINTLGGHTVSVIIALAVRHGLGRLVSLPMAVEQVLTPSLAIAAMVQLEIPHPPAAACVVYYVTLEDARQQGPLYLFMPALLGSVYMLAVQLALSWVVRQLTFNQGLAGTEPLRASGRIICGHGSQGRGGALTGMQLPRDEHWPLAAPAHTNVKPSSAPTSGDIKRKMSGKLLQQTLGGILLPDADADEDAVDELRTKHPYLSTPELRAELRQQRREQQSRDQLNLV